MSSEEIRKKMRFAFIFTITILFLTGLIIFYNNYQSVGSVIANNAGTSIESATTGLSNANAKSNVIEITANGFSPNEITINKGDSITWVNKDSKPRWPASARHPTHTMYSGVDYSAPGSYAGSEACISEGWPKTGAFDPCKSLSSNESWTFTFEQAGSWSYHDHIVSGQYGKVIVK